MLIYDKEIIQHAQDAEGDDYDRLASHDAENEAWCGHDTAD